MAYRPSPELVEDMRAKHVDVDRSLEILAKYNDGVYDHVRPVEVESIPEIDGQVVLDMTGDLALKLPRATAAERLALLLPDTDIGQLLESSASTGRGHAERRTSSADVRIDRNGLSRIGVLLLPRLAFGVLNGGSATSYADTTKNRSFDGRLFSLFEKEFEMMAERSIGRAKGLTPAFINPDGTPGPSFIELKMRGLLIQQLRYESHGHTVEGAASSGRRTAPDSAPRQVLLPLFQMTSVNNDGEIRDAYRGYRKSPLLNDLSRALGVEVGDAPTGVQPMIAALTHSDEGRPKRIFSRANGKQESCLPLPGGHGQNFSVLRDVYRALHKAGKRFVYLGNVDNIGSTVDPAALAYLALSGKQAAFDFAFRTPVDVKGGILVRARRGNHASETHPSGDAGDLTCGDIGPAISEQEMISAEAAGKKILFNCATGLFDLEYLVRNLDRITNNLPMRITDQNKDAGKYSQAEQVTWEVIGMLDAFLVYGIDKYDRFLAAKLLMETVMTSGIKLDDPRYPRSNDPSHDLHGTAVKLNRGLSRLLEGYYGMNLRNGRWEPMSVEDLQYRATGTGAA